MNSSIIQHLFRTYKVYDVIVIEFITDAEYLASSLSGRNYKVGTISQVPHSLTNDSIIMAVRSINGAAL